MMKTIGFIGVGIMGKPMARNLMKRGFSLRVFARTEAKAADLVAEGAVFCPTIGQCVQGCDVVITMVGFPKDVEEVYFNAGNILDSAAPGAAGSAQLNAFGGKIVCGDYRPGFYIKHFIKDMTLAKSEAEGEGLHLDMLSQVLANYEAWRRKTGRTASWEHSLIKYYQK